jgi:hypothetical protein
VALAAVLARPFYAGYIAGGLAAETTEMRHTLVDTTGGATVDSQPNIEYAMWPAAGLDTLDAPAKAGIAATDGAGTLIIDTSGVFSVGDPVVVLVRQVTGGAGDADDNWGVIIATVAAS